MNKSIYFWTNMGTNRLKFTSWNEDIRKFVGLILIVIVVNSDYAVKTGE